jgi:hypothetical protein
MKPTTNQSYNSRQQKERSNKKLKRLWEDKELGDLSSIDPYKKGKNGNKEVGRGSNNTRRRG